MCSDRSTHAPASNRRPCLKWRTYRRATSTVVTCRRRLTLARVSCAGDAAGVYAGCCRRASGPGRQHSHARVMFMHVTLFEGITCVRGHRRARASAAAATRAAVRVQRERRRLPGRGCDDCDAGHPYFCMVLRAARAARAARGGCVVFPAVDTLALRLARLRRGGGHPPRHADRATPSIAQTPDFRAS